MAPERVVLVAPSVMLVPVAARLGAGAGAGAGGSDAVAGGEAADAEGEAGGGGGGTGVAVSLGAMTLRVFAVIAGSTKSGSGSPGRESARLVLVGEGGFVGPGGPAAVNDRQG